MKLTKNNKHFTLEDFEHGLMLAGLVTPNSAMELNEFEALNEYEQTLEVDKSPKENTFFKRVTLAAEIAFQLHNEPTFGRIKFQKLVYLCEHAAEMELNYRYSKQVAGPFDNKFMHSIETQFEKNGWFKIEKYREGNFYRSKYVALEKVEDYKKYYNAYFSTHLEKINFILDLFRKLKTDTTEIAATLYACIIEISENGNSVNEISILDKFYSWSDAKRRFNSIEVLRVWNWMFEFQIIPSSFIRK